MKNVVTKILKKLTEWYLARNKPEIIAITGSVGKTTTRKAVSLMVAHKFKTKEYIENSYNTEIGVPLAILGQKVPEEKALWPWILIKSFFAVFSPLEIQKLVVEMGADKMGDIEYLLTFIKPKISIVTAISEAHLEQFKTLENIQEEKGKIIKVLPEDGLAVLNFDDQRVRSLNSKTKAKILTYGFEEGAKVRALDLKISLKGTKFTLKLDKEEISVLAKSIGKHSLYPLLAAAAVGLSFGYSKKEIADTLSSFSPVKGRMNIISGIKESVLIDDSYNSSPLSALAALDTLVEIAPSRKVAVLGTINEMGSYFLEVHRKVGRKAGESVDVLITVGDGGKVIGKEARLKGLDPQKIYITNNANEAGDLLKKIIKPHDTILFKGSQNKVRLERAIVKVMAEPFKAKDLLVRQGKFWQKKE